MRQVVHSKHRFMSRVYRKRQHARGGCDRGGGGGCGRVRLGGEAGGERREGRDDTALVRRQ